ncbi:hypothetical protein MTP99_002905 [Tenebrio molitor]|nr:hypothetical protein MTP99_002905 [Tenebrio molitor]
MMQNCWHVWKIPISRDTWTTKLIPIPKGRILKIMKTLLKVQMKQPEEDSDEQSEEDPDEQPEEEACGDSSSDSDSKFNIPIINLKARYGRNSWKKSDRFNQPQFDTPVPTNRHLERKDWKISDYIAMYFEDSDVENICACTNLKYLLEHDKPMNFHLDVLSQVSADKNVLGRLNASGAYCH